MAKKQPTIWPLEPRAEAKHAILRRYLQARTPIMTRWNGRVLYIDGFSGPGKYSKEEPGSPVIALTEDILKTMELADPPELVVVRRGGKGRRGTYPAGTIVEFR